MEGFRQSFSTADASETTSVVLANLLDALRADDRCQVRVICPLLDPKGDLPVVCFFVYSSAGLLRVLQMCLYLCCGLCCECCSR